MPDDFAEINQTIRSKYELIYHPSDAKQDGTYRKLRVELVDDEGKPLRFQDEKHKPLKYDFSAATATAPNRKWSSREVDRESHREGQECKAGQRSAPTIRAHSSRLALAVTANHILSTASASGDLIAALGLRSCSHTPRYLNWLEDVENVVADHEQRRDAHDHIAPRRTGCTLFTLATMAAWAALSCAKESSRKIWSSSSCSAANDRARCGENHHQQRPTPTT